MGEERRQSSSEGFEQDRRLIGAPEDVGRGGSNQPGIFKG